MSINLREILAEEEKIGSSYLTGRALESLVALLIILAISIVGLDAIISHEAFAAFLLLCAALSAISPALAFMAYRQSHVKPVAFNLRLFLALSLVAAYAVAAITLLAQVAADCIGSRSASSWPSASRLPTPGYCSWKFFGSGSGMDAPLDPRERPTPRLVSDFRRLLFSAAIGAVCTVVAEGLYLAISGRALSVEVIVVAIYIFSSLSSLAYFITTFAVFQDADHDTLAGWLAGTAPTGRMSKVQATFAGTGPNIPAQWSGLAIGSVAVLVFSPDLLRQPWVIALSAAVVTTSWLVTLVSYAVHYARVAATVAASRFPVIKAWSSGIASTSRPRCRPLSHLQTSPSRRP